MRAIVDLALDLSKSLRMEDILSILADRLKQLVPYDCLAIYVRERTVLKAQYTSGLTSQRFAALEIPVGQGLSGWVVENGKAIVNGNPAVEPGYLEAIGSTGDFELRAVHPAGRWSGSIERRAHVVSHREGRLQRGPSARVAGD